MKMLHQKSWLCGLRVHARSHSLSLIFCRIAPTGGFEFSQSCSVLKQRKQSMHTYVCSKIAIGKHGIYRPGPKYLTCTILMWRETYYTRQGVATTPTPLSSSSALEVVTGSFLAGDWQTCTCVSIVSVIDLVWSRYRCPSRQRKRHNTTTTWQGFIPGGVATTRSNHDWYFG